MDGSIDFDKELEQFRKDLREAREKREKEEDEKPKTERITEYVLGDDKDIDEVDEDEVATDPFLEGRLEVFFIFIPGS